MADAEKLKSMKREEVQALAKELGVNAGGKTEEIIARIQAAQESQAAAQGAQEGQDAAAGQEGTAQAAQGAQEGRDAAAGQEGTEQAAAQGAAEGLVTVKTIEKFFDLQLNQLKEKGEAYQVKKERAAELVAAGVAEIEK